MCIRDSLSEDHKCLMDMVEEMKADKKAAKAEAAQWLTEKRDLITERDDLKKKNQEWEKEKSETRAVSPTRIHVLQQVERLGVVVAGPGRRYTWV